MIVAPLSIKRFSVGPFLRTFPFGFAVAPFAVVAVAVGPDFRAGAVLFAIAPVAFVAVAVRPFYMDAAGQSVVRPLPFEPVALRSREDAPAVHMAVFFVAVIFRAVIPLHDDMPVPDFSLMQDRGQRFERLAVTQENKCAGALCNAPFAIARP